MKSELGCRLPLLGKNGEKSRHLNFGLEQAEVLLGLLRCPNGSLDTILCVLTGSVSSSSEESADRGSARVVPCALLHRQPLAERQSPGEGKAGWLYFIWRWADSHIAETC